MLLQKESTATCDRPLHIKESWWDVSVGYGCKKRKEMMCVNHKLSPLGFKC